MYKNVLQHTHDIAIWPVLSFVIFFLFFLCLMWYVAKADKKLIAKLKDLPFERPIPREEADIRKNMDKEKQPI